MRIDGREALQRLIRDVESGEADFSVILVYDVSRWGRFQDADESAYYEYICRRAGISVHYCAEQFDNDCSPVATIVKGVKRAMAGNTAGTVGQGIRWPVPPYRTRLPARRPAWNRAATNVARPDRSTQGRPGSR